MWLQFSCPPQSLFNFKVAQHCSHLKIQSLLLLFLSLKKNPMVFPVLSAVCVCLCVVVYVFALLLDNGIISMGQIAALAESSARTLSANISALSPAA